MKSLGPAVADYIAWAEMLIGFEVTPQMRDIIVAGMSSSNIVLLAEDFAAYGDQDAVRIESFFAPTTIEDAVQFKNDNRGCTIVQGATDVGVWMTKRGMWANLDAPSLAHAIHLASRRTGRPSGGSGPATPARP